MLYYVFLFTVQSSEPLGGLFGKGTTNNFSKYIVVEGPQIKSPQNTVEPPNKGQLGTRHFVPCSEVGG